MADRMTKEGLQGIVEWEGVRGAVSMFDPREVPEELESAWATLQEAFEDIERAEDEIYKVLYGD